MHNNPVDSMLWCKIDLDWASVTYSGPILKQPWHNRCLLSACILELKYMLMDFEEMCKFNINITIKNHHLMYKLTRYVFQTLIR